MVQHLWNPEHVTYRRYHKKRETKRSSHDVVEQFKKGRPDTCMQVLFQSQLGAIMRWKLACIFLSRKERQEKPITLQRGRKCTTTSSPETKSSSSTTLSRATLRRVSHDKFSSRCGGICSMSFSSPALLGVTLHDTQ